MRVLRSPLTDGQARRKNLNVLFDLDGTLTDPLLGISRSYDHALERLGVSRPAHIAYRDLIGPPLRSAFTALLGPDPDDHERAVALYREHFSTVGLLENTPYDGVDAMLERLHARFPLMVCTSKPTVYAERILEHFSFAKYFRAIYGCELDGTRGNKTELLACLLEREHLLASETVLIGDRMHDIAAATSCGARGLGVLWGYGSASELSEAGAMHLFAHPSEITVEALHELR